MRRALFPLSVVAVVLLGMFDAGSAGGAGGHGATPSPTGGGFVGAWRVRVIPPRGEPHPGLLTIAADGTLSAASVPSPPTLPDLPATASLFSSGHGAWATTGPLGQVIAFTIDVLVTDATGSHVSTLILGGTAVLGPEGQTLSATYDLDVAAASGPVASAGQGTFYGQRIAVELPGQSRAAA